MRIGLVAPPWAPVPPVTYGGTEAVVDNLARELTVRGHDVTLFTVGDSTCPVRRRELFLESVGPMGMSLPEAAHVLAAYEALEGMDVIHDHTLIGPLVHAARPRRSVAPLVVTHHNRYDVAALRVFREVSRHAAVVAISRDQARRALGVRIAAVIHHGVDLDLYRPGAQHADHLVFVGRMSPDKGVHRAVQIARGSGRALRIVTKMRDPDEHQYFRSRVRPLLSAEDEILIEVPPPERIAIVQSAVALLNPIAWPEPFGLVMAEALAVATPVIASPLGAAPEIVTDGVTGFLCSTVADAVAAVGRLPEIDRAACRRDAELRFSSARMAQDHEALFLRVMEDPGGHRETVGTDRGAGPETARLVAG
jgi:glycosyltransferase involved in cell wall biosynthesis